MTWRDGLAPRSHLGKRGLARPSATGLGQAALLLVLAAFLAAPASEPGIDRRPSLVDRLAAAKDRLAKQALPTAPSPRLAQWLNFLPWGNGWDNWSNH